MNEKTFKDFGEALDLLESVMRNSNKDCQKIIRESFDKLDSFYRDVKEEYGYKDNSDKEFKL